MKKIGFILFTLVLSASFILAQTDAGKKAPKAEFSKEVHDFGQIEESVGTIATEFTLKNTGDAPLLIQRIQASCGCTTPEYTNEPILPGKTGTIKVTYSTVGRPGTFNKEVTIFTNVPDAIYKIYIRGEVIRKK
jgi:hypothetical protein